MESINCFNCAKFNYNIKKDNFSDKIIYLSCFCPFLQKTGNSSYNPKKSNKTIYDYFKSDFGLEYCKGFDLVENSDVRNQISKVCGEEDE